jgi:hypothetical protein
MKCGYKNCKLGGEVEKDNAIKVSNKYYHKECHEIVENKKKIREFYLEKINPKEVMVLLNKAINELIDTKNVDSNLLLYALNYSVDNNIKINSPFGMNYIVNNYKIKESYSKLQARNKLSQIKDTNIETTETIFTYIEDENTNLMSRIKIGR